MCPRTVALAVALGSVHLAPLATPARSAQAPSVGGVTLARPEDGIDAVPVPPPPGAVVLFDSKSIDAWAGADGKSPAPWPIVEGGALEVGVGKGDIVTRRSFAGRFRLHVEFRVPARPPGEPFPGNSGVYLQGRYEVQILDSYGKATLTYQDCGGVYETAPPRVNACKAPTVWQSFDIDFEAPAFRDGAKVRPALLDVVQNGVTIQEGVRVVLDNTRSGRGGDPAGPGPIMLQDHGSAVRFRNIWLLPRP